MCHYTLEDRRYIHWLYHVPGLGRKRMGVILSSGIVLEELCAGEMGKIYDALNKQGGFSEKESECLSKQICGYKEQTSPEILWEKMQGKQIRMLLPGDEAYPNRLRKIPDAPALLYMKGSGGAAARLSCHMPVVAVVGARECSEYGKYIAAQLGETCARMGIALVSGLAYGIDGIAQRAAVEAGGMVGAVLGCGCDICYPPENRPLYNKLLEKGTVFSEYMPGTVPKANYFPPRNRIISGMSDALIVVEAKEKSGTLITVDMALEQGRDVYVIPGRLTDPMSRGCNRLLAQGALPLINIEETLMEILQNRCYDRRTVSLNKGTAPAVFCEKSNPYDKGNFRYAIYNVLDMQPKSIQQIYEEINAANAEKRCSVAALQAEIMFMQMEGIVGEKDGRFFLTQHMV